MTDEQLLRRLAEIEGIEWSDKWQEWKSGGSWAWNPLTIWEDCGPLVEKYFLGIFPMVEGVFKPWTVTIIPRFSSFHIAECDPDLKRAICLAIVEAHEPR